MAPGAVGEIMWMEKELRRRWGWQTTLNYLLTHVFSTLDWPSQIDSTTLAILDPFPTFAVSKFRKKMISFSALFCPFEQAQEQNGTAKWISSRKKLLYYHTKQHCKMDKIIDRATFISSKEKSLPPRFRNTFTKCFLVSSTLTDACKFSGAKTSQQRHFFFY